MSIWDVVTGLLLAAALFFFVAGTLGLLRFPDLYSRLHALTKADNVGLGFTVLALLPQAEDATEVVKLILIWAMVLVAGATACFLIGNEGLRRGQPVWTRGTAGDSGQAIRYDGLPAVAPDGDGESASRLGGAA